MTEKFSEGWNFQLEHLESNIMCQNGFLEPGLSWSSDSLGHFDQALSSFDVLNATQYRLRSLIQSSYSLDYRLQIVLWSEAKHYLSTYAAYSWLDVFSVMAQNGPCLKCLNCDDLFECTKCFFFVCWSYFLFSCFCHWGISSFTSALFPFLHITTLFFMSFAFMCNNDLLLFNLFHSFSCILEVSLCISLHFFFYF